MFILQSSLVSIADLIDLLTDPFADENPEPAKPANVDECLCGEPITSFGFEMCDECNDRITSKYGFDPQPE